MGENEPIKAKIDLIGQNQPNIYLLNLYFNKQKMITIQLVIQRMIVTNRNDFICQIKPIKVNIDLIRQNQPINVKIEYNGQNYPIQV